VLIVEDSPADAELVLMELRRARLSPAPTRVDNRQALVEALERETWDVVIADYRLPGWRGLDVLKILQDRQLDVPFIIVSGNIGEETAVEAMKAGAHDYVLKRNLARLGPAVARELREHEIRRERRQALAALKEMARRSAFLAETGRQLASSLHYDETLRAAARVPLPEVADWCVLTVVEAGPDGLRSEICHVDPALEALAREHIARHGVDPRARHGAAEVIRLGQPIWTTAESVLGTSDRAADAAIVGALGHASSLCVPLITRGPAIGALTLVTTSRPLERDHLSFAHDLATRIALALDNARLYREAREAIHVRDEFLSVASHELNTPLATLTLQLEDLLAGEGAPSREGRRLDVERVRRQLGRLSHLVANLLDVSRVTASRLQLEPSSVDLVAITRETAEHLAPDLARAGCLLGLQAPAPVIGRWDPLRIAQIVTNLVSNAGKYGAGKPVHITVEAIGPRARLAVRDHGIGIPLEDQQRIFECFERAVSARHFGGLGLGLYITRQLVEAHGGNLSVTSELGAGSTFVVDLPVGA
jgi:signal transduction histidine kinase/FixJ family two-component response regulator